MIRVGIIAFPGVDDLDLVGARAVLQKAKDGPAGSVPIVPQVLTAAGADSVVCAGGTVIPADGDWTLIEQCDAVLIPGGSAARTFQPCETLKAQLTRTIDRNRPVYCVCSGAFILANAGLAEGRRLAVHKDKVYQLRQAGACKATCGLIQDGPVWSIGGIESSAGVKSVSMGLLVLEHHSPALSAFVRRRMELPGILTNSIGSAA